MSEAGREARRPAALAVLLVLAGCAGLALSGAPRMVLVNAAIEVLGRATHALGALGALAAFALAAWLVATPRAARLVLLALALVAGAVSLDRALLRVRVDERGIAARGLFGTTRLAWSEVTRVDTGSSTLVVWGRDEAQVRVSVGAFRADQRATLERSIARHVREAAAR